MWIQELGIFGYTLLSVSLRLSSLSPCVLKILSILKKNSIITHFSQWLTKKKKPFTTHLYNLKQNREPDETDIYIF